MKKVIIVLLASLSLTSCSVMKKHKTFQKAKLDSTATVHKAIEVKTESAQTAHDTSTVVSSKTVSHDIDTNVFVPGHTSTATLIAGDTDAVVETPDGDTISIHVNPDKSTTVKASTPASHIPIKIHDRAREVDTVTAINARKATQEVKTDTQSAVATKVSSKDVKEAKTKDKTVFSFPWYVWLIAALAVIIWLVWRNRATIAKWLV